MHRRLTSQDFLRALQRITPSKGWPARIAIAVSGGPDSIALLHLMACYARAEHKQLVAVTVDHQLRRGSAAEAKEVEQFAMELGLKHHTLTIPWGESPFPAFPQLHQTEDPARVARLLLYRELFRRERLDSLWTGHHRGDQVENLLMRGRGMQSVARMESDGIEDEEMWIVRPFLGFDKDQLIEYCHYHALPYFIDPTNSDPLHTPRNALRQSLALAQARHLSHPHTLPSATLHNSGPQQLLHRILPPPSPPSLPPRPPPGLITLHHPHLSTITLHPQHLPARTSPSYTRALLRRTIAFIAPSSSPISDSALEISRRRIWDPSPVGQKSRSAFTPGAGVMFSPRPRTHPRAGAVDSATREWIVARQPKRSAELRRSQRQFELQEGIGRTWDGRFWFLLHEGAGSGWTYPVEERGRWSLPVVVRRREGGQEEVVLDLGRRRRKGEEVKAGGVVEVERGRLSWKCRGTLQ